MDEKRVAELRLIQAALAFHVSEIAYQKSAERASIFSVEDRLHGKGDYEAERGEYIKRRVELTLACEQYAKLFKLEKPAPDPADFECTCDHMQDEAGDVVATIRDRNCPVHKRKPAPAGGGARP